MGCRQSRAYDVPRNTAADGSRQCFVKIVDIENGRTFGGSISAEIGEVAVPANLQAETGDRSGSKIASHYRRRTTQKSKCVGFHPRVAHRQQLGEPAPALLDQDFNRIGSVSRRVPFRVRPERYPLPPLGTECPPLTQRHRRVCPRCEDVSMLGIIGSRWDISGAQ